MSKILTLSALVGAMMVSPAAIAAASAQDLDVVASFSILADFAAQVGGDRITLTTLVGPDGDAHVYEPKPTDAVAVSKAGIVLVNGLQFEGFLPRLVEASETKAEFVEASAGAEIIAMGQEAHAHHGDAAAGEEADAGVAPEHGHEHGATDPHAWQSVPNAETYVKNIAAAFCGADSAGCATYEGNAAAYLAKLQALDAEIRAEVESIPADRRTIITSHDAFGYFAHEYGLTFLAPEGVSTDAEASAADIAALIEQVREDKASAIFVENITNTRLIEQIASETGLTVGGSLYSDALSGEDGPASTYLDMMRHNIRTIKGAIVGS